MYLVIAKPDHTINRSAPKGFFCGFYTDDIHLIYQCLNEGDTVYRLDGLTQIGEVKIDYQVIEEKDE